MAECNTKSPTPIPTVPTSDPLPTFSSLRSLNLHTLYGDVTSNYSLRDKSPKGSVDDKVLPLVNLINCHPEYVTLSSCSGRVALFDPGLDDDHVDEGVDHERLGVHHGSDEHDVVPLEDCNNNLDNHTPINTHEGCNNPNPPLKTNTHNSENVTVTKSVNISGKGRGKWIFVTHDILPDLGSQIIHALKKAGDEGHVQRQRPLPNNNNANATENQEAPRKTLRKTLSLKHEPPLLHIGASSLSSGKRMLHLVKSKCAMRESGLIVTDSRVTVEVRTVGGALCVPVFVDVEVLGDGGGYAKAGRVMEIHPHEEYLLSLAEIMNERMMQNEKILGKLYSVLEKELFYESDTKMTCHGNDFFTADESAHDFQVSLHPLPSLNLWKTAAVALPYLGTPHSDSEVNGVDLDVLAFGGQGIGPYDSSNNSNSVKNTTCQRMDAVFRLKKRDGSWSHNWDTVKLDETILNDGSNDSNDLALETNAGTFRVDIVKSLGRREGHSACVLPQWTLPTSPMRGNVVAIFGGRTGGPLSPTNDLFLFTLHHCNPRDDINDDDAAYGIACIPTDVRGVPPEARYGHSMTALQYRDYCNEHSGRRVDALAAIAGGMGVSSTDGSTQVVFSSVHVLSRCRNDDDSESCHFVWEKIADMQVPRSYHSAIRVPLECKSGVLVFGGISKADDPFDDDDIIDYRPHFELFRCGQNTWASDSSSKECQLPLVIGGSSVWLGASSSSEAFMVIGGVKPCTRTRTEEKDTLAIFRWASNDSASVESPIKADTTILQNGGNFDLGVCVHHCLVQIPTSKDTTDDSDIISSAISVGGGVPSFSFGQSYSKSFLVNVKRCSSSVKDALNESKLQPSIPLERPQKERSSISSQPEADVVYVYSSHAKKLKIELESLGYLDKSFKMVKVAEGGTNLIAVPITESCLSYIRREGNRADPSDGSGDNKHAYTFESLIVKIGRESVPLSSSSMSKLKQRR